eukprot:scaffold537_cov180-Ochromonas_danica.AAC.28
MFIGKCIGHSTAVIRKAKGLIMPGIEPGTFSVLTKCDNRYTTRPCTSSLLSSNRTGVVKFGRFGLLTLDLSHQPPGILDAIRFDCVLGVHRAGGKCYMGSLGLV